MSDDVEFRLALAGAIDAAIQSGVAVVDTSGRKIHVNDAMCRLVGWPREELVGAMPPFVYWPPEELPQIDAVFRRALAGHTPPHGEDVVLCRRDGSRFPANLHVAPLMLQGRVAGWVANIKDMSAAEATGAELRFSRQRFREIAEHIQEVFYVNDVAAGRLTYLSPSFERVWGRPSREVIENPTLYIEAIEPAWRDAAFEAFAVQRQGRDTVVTYPIRRPDGTRAWIRDQSYPIVEGGVVRRVVGIAADITALKAAEEELRRSLEQLGEAEMVAGLGHCELDLAGGTMTWSDGWRRLLGLGAAERPSYRAALRRVHPRDRAHLREAHRALLSARPAAPGPDVLDLSFRVLGPAGERHVRERVRRNLDAAGRPLRLMVVLQDITDSVRAQTELRNLSQALEYSPSGTLVTDVDRLIVFANRAFCDMSGYTREELIGQSVVKVRSENTPREVIDAITQCRRLGVAWHGKALNRRKDGVQRLVSLSVAPVRDEQGEVTHFVSNEIDITERERLATELARHREHLEELVQQRTAELAAARARAEAASRAKSDFLANVSHEIRTPMNAIVGLTHLLLDDEAVTPAQAERLRSIDTASQQLLAVVTDVLDLSKIEAGRLELDPAPFDPRALVDAACAVVCPRAAAKGLATSLTIEPDVPAQLVGDSVRINQVLLNLLSNAVKFTERGEVSLSLGVVARTPQAVRLRFEVRDTGIGIDSTQLARVFEPFEQADSSTTRRYGGTGLGLSISRRIAEAMGGAIGASSVPGEGSTFWVELLLPLAATASGNPDLHDAARSPAPAGRGTGGRVLLVDDNRLNRRVAADVLTREGYEVDQAGGGAAAIEMAARNAYAAILMDLQMPDVDGVQAAEAIRRMPRHAATPILAMSGNVQEADRLRCLAAGMSDFISKPVRPVTLLARLARWTTGLSEVRADD